MAHNQEGFRVPLRAASVFGQYVPVMFSPSGISEGVHRAGSFNDTIIGMTTATAANVGDPVGVQVDGVSKAVAGASLGAGAYVGVGCVNGILIPVQASGMSTALGSALGAQGLRFKVGIALKSAAAGDVFPILIDPDQVI